MWRIGQYITLIREMYSRMRRLRWIGHILRMYNSRESSRTLNGKIQARRPVERPRK